MPVVTSVTALKTGSQIIEFIKRGRRGRTKGDNIIVAFFC